MHVVKKLLTGSISGYVFSYLLVSLSISAYSANPVLDFAKQQISQKLYLPAISTLNTYLETHPKDVDALYWKAFSYFKTENFIAAEELYKNVVKLNNKYLPAYEDLASMHMKQKKYPDALQYLNTAIALHDSDVNLLNSRGMCFYYLDKFELAIKDFRAVVKLDPQNYLAYNNMGSAEYNNQNIASASIQDLKLADRDFSMAIKLKPDFELAFRNRGIVRYYMDSLEASGRDLMYAIKLNPEDPNAHFYVGKLYYKQHNLPLAMQFYDNAIRIEKNNADFYLDRGICKIDMGDYQGSRSDFYKGMQKTDDNKFFEYQVARSFAAEGKKGDVMYALREAYKSGLFIDLRYYNNIVKDKYFVKWARDKEYNDFIKELKFGKKK